MEDLAFWVLGCGFWVWSLGFTALGCGNLGSGFRFGMVCGVSLRQ